jgi:GTP cyclohydrolase II
MFEAMGFEHELWTVGRTAETALALVVGDLSQGVPLLRVHSQCLTGEVFGSLCCDCGGQLNLAVQAIAQEGRGLVLYEFQEGRGQTACGRGGPRPQAWTRTQVRP